jgi:hypothetical protein
VRESGWVVLTAPPLRLGCSASRPTWFAGDQFCRCSETTYRIPAGAHACSEPLYAGHAEFLAADLPQQLCSFFKQVGCRGCVQGPGSVYSQAADAHSLRLVHVCWLH